MKTRAALFALCLLLLACACAHAADVELGSRKFKHLSLAVGQTPPDCRGVVNHGAVLSYIHDALHASLAGRFEFVHTDNAPVLMTTWDCLLLTDDTERGGGRSIGFAINITMSFYRPFREDLAYLYAAPWTKSTLLFIPHRDFSQAFFNSLLDDSLAEFSALWLADHPAPLEQRQGGAAQ